MNTPHLSFIKDSLEAASKIAVSNFGQLGGTTKPEDNNQVLTKTDLEVGKLLVDAVAKQFPDHNIIDEEAGVVDRHSEFTWVIDPIDGTSNFAAGVPTYGILIGLLHDGRPVAGGIALPSFGEIYLGEPGQGATLNGQPISVTKETKLLSSLVSYCVDGHQEDPARTQAEAEFMGRLALSIRNLRTSNSTFDAAMVARGAYGACLNQGSRIWDNVAQQAVIEAAGGVYTDFQGQPIDYTNPIAKADDNFTWCFGSAALHQAIQAIVHDKA